MEDWQFIAVVACMGVAFIAGLVAAAESTSEFDVLD